jgi:hypothetical protein
MPIEEAAGAVARCLPALSVVEGRVGSRSGVGAAPLWFSRVRGFLHFRPFFSLGVGASAPAFPLPPFVIPTGAARFFRRAVRAMVSAGSQQAPEGIDKGYCLIYKLRSVR